MKTKHFFYALLCAATLTAACDKSEDDPTQTGEVIDIPDPAFRAYCLENFDRNGDGKIREGEAAVVTDMSVSHLGIQSLAGIEHFVALESFSCTNNNLTTIDVSKNTALVQLYCGKNQFTNLDVSKNTALRWLLCYDNRIDTLDLAQNVALDFLVCDNNNLSVLDVSKNVVLTELNCAQNRITYLDVSGCVNLESLYCYENNLIQLDVSNNKKLSHLDCESNPILLSIFVWQGCNPENLDWHVPFGVKYIVAEEP